MRIDSEYNNIIINYNNIIIINQYFDFINN